MLEVGCAHGPGGPSDPGLSYTEARTHFNAWCIVSSPLTLSHDLTNDTVQDAVWPIITNTEALAVSAAWAGASGSPFKSSGVERATRTKADENAAPTWQFFSKPVSATSTAILLMNHDSTSHDFTVNFADVPGLNAATSYKLRDINAHADLGSFTGSWSITGVASHDAPFILISSA
jgi:alpha-galactosidase